MVLLLAGIYGSCQTSSNSFSVLTTVPLCLAKISKIENSVGVRLMVWSLIVTVWFCGLIIKSLITIISSLSDYCNL